MGRKLWGNVENEYLLKNYKKITASDVSDIIKIVGFSRSCIKAHAIELGIYEEKEYNAPTDKDILFIKNNYLSMTVSKICEILKLNESTVRSVATRMGLYKGKSKPWSDEELVVLKNSYGRLSNKEISKLLNEERSASAIQCKAHKIGIDSRINFWTKEEDSFLLNNYYSGDKNFILENLNNRTWTAVIDRVKELDVKRDTHPWSEIEDSIIINNWETLQDFQLMELLPNRTQRSIKWRRSVLGLERNIGHSIGTSIISKNGDKCHSLGECILIEYIYGLGFEYRKDVPYVELIIGDNTNRTCDICIYYDNKIYAIEYFGIYRKTTRNKIEDTYVEKMAYKYDCFKYYSKENVVFVPIYPDQVDKNDAKKAKQIIYNILKEK